MQSEKSLEELYKELMAGEDQKVAAAKQEAAPTNKALDWAEAFQGLSVPRTRSDIALNLKPTQPTIDVKGLRDSANRGVTEAETGKKSALDNFLTTDKLKQTGVDRTRATEMHGLDISNKNLDIAGKQSTNELNAFKLKDAKAANELTLSASDPNSALSAQARLSAIKMGADPATIKGMSATQLETQFPHLKDIFKAQADAKLAGQRLANDAANRDSANTTRKQAVDERQDRYDESQATKLGKDLSNLQNSLHGIAEVEKLIGKSVKNKGFDLDQFNPDSQTINGKKFDLPGVAVPGIGGVSFFSGDARELDGAMSRIFNIELKGRSGAAVTEQELARLQREFNEGKFHTEPEKLAALKRFKGLLHKAMIEERAKYKPTVNQTFDRNRESVIQSTLSEDDKQALLWADENKDDPRAKEIIKRIRGN